MSDESKREPKKRLFLYTDEADLSEEMAAALVANGFVPIKVRDVTQVKIVEPSLFEHLDGASIDAMGAAALDVIAKNSANTGWVAQHFVHHLLRRLQTVRG